MSSDNFYLIRRARDRFAVSMEFDSSIPDQSVTNPTEVALGAFYYPTPIDAPGLKWFDDLAAASNYAHSEYSEYGVTTSIEEDSTEDTRSARRDALLLALGTAEDGVLLINDHTDGTVTLSWANYEVRVTGRDFSDASALAGCLGALLTTPDH